MTKPKGPFDEAILGLNALKAGLVILGTDGEPHLKDSGLALKYRSAIAVLEAAGKVKIEEADGAFGIFFTVAEGQILNVTALLEAIWEAGK